MAKDDEIYEKIRREKADFRRGLSRAARDTPSGGRTKLDPLPVRETERKRGGPLPKAPDELGPPSSPFVQKLELDYQVARAKKRTGKRRPLEGLA